MITVLAMAMLAAKEVRLPMVRGLLVVRGFRFPAVGAFQFLAAGAFQFPAVGVFRFLAAGASRSLVVGVFQFLAAGAFRFLVVGVFQFLAAGAFQFPEVTPAGGLFPTARTAIVAPLTVVRPTPVHAPSEYELDHTNTGLLGGSGLGNAVNALLNGVAAGTTGQIWYYALALSFDPCR